MHQEMAFRVAYLVLGDAAEAQDAAQEAFVKAYRAIDRFREGSAFRPWLLRIVSNAARNRRRAAGRRRGLQLRAEAATRSATPRSVGRGDRCCETSAAGRCWRRSTPSRREDRLVIGARYFLDLPEAEIAALAGVARGTVKSRLSRARARLAQALGGDRAGWLDA